jgi:hypothetical protein
MPSRYLLISVSARDSRKMGSPILSIEASSRRLDPNPDRPLGMKYSKTCKVRIHEDRQPLPVD